MHYINHSLICNYHEINCVEEIYISASGLVSGINMQGDYYAYIICTHFSSTHFTFFQIYY